MQVKCNTSKCLNIYSTKCAFAALIVYCVSLCVNGVVFASNSFPKHYLMAVTALGQLVTVIVWNFVLSLLLSLSSLFLEDPRRIGTHNLKYREDIASNIRNRASTFELLINLLLGLMQCEGLRIKDLNMLASKRSIASLMVTPKIAEDSNESRYRSAIDFSSLQTVPVSEHVYGYPDGLFAVPLHSRIAAALASIRSEHSAATDRDTYTNVELVKPLNMYDSTQWCSIAAAHIRRINFVKLGSAIVFECGYDE